MNPKHVNPSDAAVVLRQEHLCQTVSSWTGIPAERLIHGRQAAAGLTGLREELARHIFGQSAAIDSAVSALERRFHLPERPGVRRSLWNALCAGPSGVGKTELARQLAVYLFGDLKALIQVDCSELDQEHHTARLVGSPPGYVGHGEGGQLSNALRRRNDGVILFDEVEKAHPVIITNVLLPLLGEGMVHDMNDVRSLDATNMVVILTSNLGCCHAKESTASFYSSDAGPAEIRQETILAAIQEHFPREVLGRIDDIIVFEPLGPEALHHIWRREVQGLEQRLAGRGATVHIEIGEETETMLLGYIRKDVDHQGARAVVRFFDKIIVDRCLNLLRDGLSGPAAFTVERTDEGGLRYRLTPNLPAGARGM